jgi:hypothetical protein
MRDTFGDIVRDADTRFLWSGAISRPEFFAKHVVYLTAWCKKYSIRPEEGHMKAVEELLLVKDWSREYWH